MSLLQAVASPATSVVAALVALRGYWLSFLAAMGVILAAMLLVANNQLSLAINSLRLIPEVTLGTPRRADYRSGTGFRSVVVNLNPAGEPQVVQVQASLKIAAVSNKIIEEAQRDQEVRIDPHGEILGHYHKTQFAEGLHQSWYFNRIGRQIRAFDTPLGRMGMMICNDRANPQIARTLVLDGARLLLIVSYGTRKKSQNRIVMARARENGVPIVQANVGMNLIISKGEIAAYKWGCDQITTAVVEVPAPPSTTAALASEQEYMQQQGPRMAERYQRTMDRVRREAEEAAA